MGTGGEAGPLHLPTRAAIERVEQMRKRARTASLSDAELRLLRAAIWAGAVVLGVTHHAVAVPLIDAFRASGHVAAIELAHVDRFAQLTGAERIRRSGVDEWHELRAHLHEVLAVMARDVTMPAAKLEGLDFGQRIAQLRWQRGWYQGDLAQRLGVSVQTVNAWERGRSKPSLMHLNALVKALHTTRRALLNGD